MRQITFVMIGGAMALGSSTIMAQTCAVQYTTEWQTDLGGGYDWLNLLQTSARLPVYRALSFEASTISTVRGNPEPLLDDLLTYSNIEAGTIPLTFSRLGLGLALGRAELFVGINNVNQDYFTSELTSHFTNSSCGISPTISCNYDIANYPVASWCVHYRQSAGHLGWQTSLYPGRGYYRLAGHDNLFSLDINSDGIFSISSIEYRHNGIYTVLGLALYYGVCAGDVAGVPSSAPLALSSTTASARATSMSLSAAPWLLAEVGLPCNLGLLVHASMSTVNSGCRAFGSLGLVYDGEHVQPGISFNYAKFTDAAEYDLELCACIPLVGDKVSLQPALHLVGTGGAAPRCVGLLRLALSF